MSHCDDPKCPCRRHFITAAEAARLVRKSRRTVYRWLDEEFLIAKKVKNGWLIRTADLLNLPKEKIM